MNSSMLKTASRRAHARLRELLRIARRVHWSSYVTGVLNGLFLGGMILRVATVIDWPWIVVIAPFGIQIIVLFAIVIYEVIVNAFSKQ